jgi:hypothetical protein
MKRLGLGDLVAGWRDKVPGAEAVFSCEKALNKNINKNRPRSRLDFSNKIFCYRHFHFT